MRRPVILFGLLTSTAACSNSSNGPDTSSTSPSNTTTDSTLQSVDSQTLSPTSTGTGSGVSTQPSSGVSHQTTSTGGAGQTTGVYPATSNTNEGSTDTSGVGPTGGDSESNASSDTSTSSGNQDNGSSGASTSETGTQTGTTSTSEPDGSSGPLVPSCVGEGVPNADPESAGPFQVTADKNVGPLAGVVPDPIYGDQQQRYNVYRPSNLADSAYCHPILIWANGYRDNPEQKPPDCVVDSGANRWCGQYLPLMNHLASHGFVVVASLSTATAEGDPLPTIAGLDWILEQAEDPTSPYYHRLDTANIGQLGHSYGGMSTCMSASEPRYKALATICGTRELSGVHTPMLFFCGGNDTTVECSGVRDTFLTVTDQPAFFINERNADHGSWVYGGPNGVSLSSAAAWFRTHLMGDTDSRGYFYGENCTFCSDNRVEVEQNSLMLQ